VNKTLESSTPTVMGSSRSSAIVGNDSGSREKEAQYHSLSVTRQPQTKKKYDKQQSTQIAFKNIVEKIEEEEDKISD